MSRIGLGTVQFGLDYGISNRGGMTARDEAAGILDFAAKSGVRVLDTAALYGRSEEVLGALLKPSHGFAIVTKTVKLGAGAAVREADADMVEKAFRLSLSRLGRDSVYGLLLHDADDALRADGRLLMDRMLELKESGLAAKIGVSVYEARQIDEVAARYKIDIVQLPLNVFDRRLLDGGHIAALKKEGVEVHARSVFLQGLLLMAPGELPAYFDGIRDHVRRYREHLRKNGVSALRAALGFVLGVKGLDAAVCGVNDRGQLDEILAAEADPRVTDLAGFALSDEAVLNPSKWMVA